MRHGCIATQVDKCLFGLGITARNVSAGWKRGFDAVEYSDF